MDAGKEKETTIQLTIRCSSGNAVLTMEKSNTIADLIKQIQTFGIDEKDQRWIVEEEENAEYAVDYVEDDDEEKGWKSADEESVEELDDNEDEAVDREWSFEQKKAVVDYYNAKPGRTFASVKRRFKRVTPKQLTRFKKQVADGGTRSDKWRIIDQQLLQRFNEARKDMLPVHNNDLRRWALNAASAVRLSTTISNWWLLTWKRRHGIVSRKVSKVWSAAKLLRSAETEAAAVEFRQEVQSRLADYDPDMIMNTDQSGFQYEYFSGRTLSYKGEQATPIAIRSMGSTTHSYTIQPTLSLSGKLQSPLYLCTQEVGGKMGPQVRATFFKPQNVVVTCSASGKLMTGHCEYYAQNVLAPMLTGNCLLLLDSWGGQQSDESFQCIGETGFTCERMCIPPGATATTQPLDVFYNRQWKQVVRQFYDHVMVQRLNINMYTRDNIIKMQSLVHHMFSHDRFVPMGQYAFYASGLRPDRPERFERATDILFPSTLDTCDNCPGKAFIRCVHCGANLCFNEFFVNYHNHLVVEGVCESMGFNILKRDLDMYLNNMYMDVDDGETEY